MLTFKNTLKNLWDWFYERTALWIILLLGVSFMSGINDLSVQSSKTKLGNAECKSDCHPVSYEYIQGNQSNSCWCYVDKETLKPYEK